MSARGLVWSRGRIEPAERATVSAVDRGFLLGDGLFETMLAVGARIFRLERHLERLAAGAARVGIPPPQGVGEALAELLATANDEARAGAVSEATGREWAVRLTLTRGESAGGLLPAPGPPTLTLWVWPAPSDHAAARERGLRLRTASHRVCSRSALAGVKALGYLGNVCALAEARAAGADDALLLDENDRVAEASASNVFWVSAAGTLRTPSAGCGILPGLTRAEVLDLARGHGLEAEEGEWSLAELTGAREAFATSTLRGVAPVVDLDGRPLGEGAAGPLTRALGRAWLELVFASTEPGR